MNRATDRSRKRSMAFSAVAILAAALGTPLLLSSLKQAARPEAGMRPVVVAAADLPISKVLEATDLKVVSYPEHLVPEDAVPEVEALIGRTVRQDILDGEPIREYRLADAARGRGLHALIEPGMRAMALRVDEQIGVSGFIQPNNYVDVVVALRPRGAVSEYRARTVLQRVRVLAVGTETETRGSKAVSVSTVTLMVTPEQQEQLSMALAEGKVTLSLRNDVDATVAQTDGVGVREIVGVPEATRARGAARGRARVARSQGPKDEPAPEVPTHEVEVYRGGSAETRSFVTVGGAP